MVLDEAVVVDTTIEEAVAVPEPATALKGIFAL